MIMKKRFTLFLHIIVVLFSFSILNAQQSDKPRLIITTDIGGDPDDQQSLTRLLLYANEFDLEGLIASASGTPGELGRDTVNHLLILKYIDAYRKVYPTLILHDKNYPEPGYLETITKKGNQFRGWKHVGDGHDTEASEWIITTVNKEDSRNVNIAIWGGQTDLAQALWKVKNTRSDQEYNNFVSKIRVYDIADQDNIFENMHATFPGLFYILNKAPKNTDKRNAAFRGMYLGGDETLTSDEWINTNIRKNHGPLGALYPDATWTAPNPYKCLKEGDTPSWFFFLSNGLQDTNHPEWGGWGGRFIPAEKGLYRDATDYVNGTCNARASVYRWRENFQNDFAARIDRCIKRPGEVNHPPVVIISADSSKNIIRFNTATDDDIELSAADSFDPDGNKLFYHWWVYPEAGKSPHCVDIGFNKLQKLNFKVPAIAKGTQIHIICEVADDGEPALTSVRRVVLDVE